MAKVDRLKVFNPNQPVVHPAANVFRMMTDDELQELADDIKENGLRNSIVLDSEGRLLDGRNRLKACEIAGVEPRFETYEGDPDAYVVSLNVTRRHLNAGQRAMGVALIYPEPEKRGRGNRAEKSFPGKDFSEASLSRARTVLKYGRDDLVPQVVDGSLFLKQAYEIAMQRKAKAETTDDRMATLRAKASDLVSMVDEERLTLDEAFAAFEQRERERAAEIRSAQHAAQCLWSFAAHVATVVKGIRLGASDLLDDDAQFQALQDAWELLVETKRELRQGGEE
jgi:hypothetical protein